MKKIATILSTAFLFLVPVVVSAQDLIENPLGAATFDGILIDLTEWLLGLVALLALLGIVYGGIRMVIAVGNEQQLSEAKKIVTWSIAGVLVAGLAYAIVSIVATEILSFNEILTIPAAHAANIEDTIGLNKASGLGLTEFSAAGIVEKVVLFITSIAGLITLAVFIYGAVMFILSAGDESRASNAKKIMLYAIIGLLLVGGAYVILRVAGIILGLDSNIE